MFQCDERGRVNEAADEDRGSKKHCKGFANRYRNYETESGIHEVWTVTVPKDRILASFTEDGKNNEEEVIVNLYGEKFEIRREAV